MQTTADMQARALFDQATPNAQGFRWDPAAPLVVVCRSGGRSSNAAAQLAAAGFTRVMNMAGGMLAYRAEGLPVAP